MTIIDGKAALRRKKSKILDIDPGLDDGKYITVQIQLDNGEVVIGHYSRHCWVQAPYDLAAQAAEKMSRPPVAVIGKRLVPSQ